MAAAAAWCKAHAKTLTAAAGAAVGIAVTIWGTGNKWVALAVAVATVAGVYRVPNAGKSKADSKA